MVVLVLALLAAGCPIPAIVFAFGLDERTGDLVTAVIQHVRRAAQRGRPILWVVDGFAAWSSGILKVFRDPRPTGRRGRPPLVVWPDLHVVQVVKCGAQAPRG